jgi:hypothetical protein
MATCFESYVEVDVANVTIAIDERTLAAGRHYAREHHTSLNKLIRQLLERTVVRTPSEGWSDEFFALADDAQGDSSGRRWKREELYDV